MEKLRQTNTLNGKSHGHMLKYKKGELIMNLTKKIKQKYHFKYITLIFLFMLYIPLVGIIVTQFKYKYLFPMFYIFFILLFIVDMLLSYIYYKKMTLPDLETYDILKKYLEYFSSSIFSDLEYTESITWFSRLVQTSFRKKEEANNDILNNTVHKLYLVLRPNSQNLCDALKRKSAFSNLATKLLNNEDISEDIANFKNIDIESYKYFSLILDKNILIYTLVLSIHIFACFLLTKGSCSQFNPNFFFGNLLLYGPADLLAILVYKGIVKSTKE
jgi:hypothetical protein